MANKIDMTNENLGGRVTEFLYVTKYRSLTLRSLVAWLIGVFGSSQRAICSDKWVKVLPDDKSPSVFEVKS